MPCIFRPKSVAHIPVDFISIPIYSHSLSVIKETYRKLALRWHTGKKTNHLDKANRRFREISEAYEVLSDGEYTLYSVQARTPLSYITRQPLDVNVMEIGRRIQNTHTQSTKKQCDSDDVTASN